MRIIRARSFRYREPAEKAGRKATKITKVGTNENWKDRLESAMRIERMGRNGHEIPSYEYF